MIPSKLGSKRSKRSKGIDSDEDYQAHKLSKLKKASSKTKKEPKKKPTKLTSTSNKWGLSESSSVQGSENDGVPANSNVKYVPLQVFNANQVFALILNKATKEPDFLIMLKNLLSGCSRTLSDKKNMYKKKWKQLRNSNCSQEEYLSRQEELKRSEHEDIHEMERDIMSKLSYAQIKGFETKELIIDSYKRTLEPEALKNGDVQWQFDIEEEKWDSYYEEQRRLLELLMKQNDFVSQDYTPSNLIKTYSEPIKERQQAFKEQVFEDNEIGARFKHMETEDNPTSTQFLFCKHYKDINYDRVFSGSMNSFRPKEEEKFYVNAKAMGWLLETKSDEIYTNEKFQKETYKRYSEMLLDMYKRPQNYSEKETVANLLEVGAYMLNSVHYYQKFKLKCDLLHPLDLLLVIEKIRGQSRVNDQTATVLASVKNKVIEKMEEEKVVNGPSQY